MTTMSDKRKWLDTPNRAGYWWFYGVLPSDESGEDSLVITTVYRSPSGEYSAAIPSYEQGDVDEWRGKWQYILIPRKPRGNSDKT